jgi:hypothetical protein
MAPGKTRFTYRVGIDPRLPVAAGGPLSHVCRLDVQECVRAPAGASSA